MAPCTARTLAVSALALLALSLWATTRELASGRDHHRAHYAGAASCSRCHPKHAESFRRTFHRTMTQIASETSVLGDFGGATLDYFGVRAQMERDPLGNFILRYGSHRIPERRWVIKKTVGSRRYQQYIAQVGDELLRLPVAWHIEEQRWFHMNGAFLTPDPSPETALDANDYERHVTRWNDNCVFCHNVAPNPGKQLGVGGEPHFSTSVAEHGIACEACHGPGREHGRVNQNPLRRYLLHASDRPDPTIVQPERLPPDRSLDLCGRCHGQRITSDVEAFLRQGDPFVAGDSLAQYSAPIWRDTPLHGDASSFEARFWPDGTPRLTAYEYQGVLLSACAQQGPLTCLDCHAMHEGDPRGQLRPDKTATTMCTDCHSTLRSSKARAAHHQHPPGADTPSCLDCHMPKIVYGVLDVHRSHRIASPDPAREGEKQRPDACTLCHVDRTRAWAARERDRLWSASVPEPPTTPWSEVETALFTGDPIARAVAAAALEHSPLRIRGEDRVASLLLDVMEHDPYPAIRHLALRALKEPVAFTPEWPQEQRRVAIERLYRERRLSRPDAKVIDALRAQARKLDISIGE